MALSSLRVAVAVLRGCLTRQLVAQEGWSAAVFTSLQQTCQAGLGCISAGTSTHSPQNEEHVFGLLEVVHRMLTASAALQTFQITEQHTEMSMNTISEVTYTIDMR